MRVFFSLKVLTSYWSEGSNLLFAYQTYYKMGKNQTLPWAFIFHLGLSHHQRSTFPMPAGIHFEWTPKAHQLLSYSSPTQENSKPQSVASNHPFALAPGHGDKSELTDPQAGTRLCFAESRPRGGDRVGVGSYQGDKGVSEALIR